MDAQKLPPQTDFIYLLTYLLWRLQSKQGLHQGNFVKVRKMIARVVLFMFSFAFPRDVMGRFSEQVKNI